MTHQEEVSGQRHNMEVDGAHQNWIPVSPRYLPYLRASVSIQSLLFVAIPAGLFFFNLDKAAPVKFALLAVCVVILCFYLLNLLILLPRRFLRLRYLIREQDIHVRRGYLFRSIISVSINRIQHLEVQQGALERAFDVSELRVYTAGGAGSDLKIPGLPFELAQSIKQSLLAVINAEKSHTQNSEINKENDAEPVLPLKTPGSNDG